MLKYPKISIVTPSYNQAAFLEKTILSVLDQSYPNLEYIVMDGGSDDGSVDIIRKYEKHLTYWVSEKDNGQTDAVNRGLKMCTGEILDWINSDDRLKPGALLSVVEATRACPDAGAWVGACDLIDEHGKYIQTVKPRGLVRDRMADWGGAGHFFQPSCFISRKAWEKYGPLNVWHSMCFDVDLYLKIATEYEFYGVETVWTEATIHKDAKTQAQVPLMMAEIYAMQMHHGFDDLAIKNITRAVAGSLEAKVLKAQLAELDKQIAELKKQNPLNAQIQGVSARKEPAPQVSQPDFLARTRDFGARAFFRIKSSFKGR